MENSPSNFIFEFISGDISFSSFCELFGLCFLCWLFSYLIRCVMRRLPDSFPGFLTYTIMMLWGLFGLLGFPVTLCIAIKDHFDFAKIEKAAKSEERESMQELVDSYRREAESLRSRG